MIAATRQNKSTSTSRPIKTDTHTHTHTHTRARARACIYTRTNIRRQVLSDFMKIVATLLLKLVALVGSSSSSTFSSYLSVMFFIDKHNDDEREWCRKPTTITPSVVVVVKFYFFGFDDQYQSKACAPRHATPHARGWGWLVARAMRQLGDVNGCKHSTERPTDRTNERPTERTNDRPTDRPISNNQARHALTDSDNDDDLHALHLLLSLASGVAAGTEVHDARLGRGQLEFHRCERLASLQLLAAVPGVLAYQVVAHPPSEIISRR